MTLFSNLPPQSKLPQLSDVAMFVGAALQHDLPECNTFTADKFRKVSTILVSQYKQKFSDIRIYCELAHERLVKEAYTASEPKMSYKDFLSYRVYEDASHYRICYKTMMAVAPEYKDALFNGADRPELLVDSETEMEPYICAWLDKTYRCADLVEVKSLLRRVCGLI